MTLTEKNIIKTFLTQAEFYSYNGEIELRNMVNILDEKYDNNNGEIEKSQKKGMLYTNDMFPIFLQAWKTEKDKVIDYFDAVKVYNEDFPFDILKKIMEKYYD